MTYRILRRDVTLSPAEILYTQSGISEYFSKKPYRTQSVVKLFEELLFGWKSIHDVPQICVTEGYDENLWVVDGHRRLTVFKLVQQAFSHIGQDFFILATIIEIRPETFNKIRTTRTEGKRIYFTSDNYKSASCDAWTRLSKVLAAFLKSPPAQNIERPIDQQKEETPEPDQKIEETGFTLESDQQIQETRLTLETDLQPEESSSESVPAEQQQKDTRELADGIMSFPPTSSSGEVSRAARNSASNASVGAGATAPRTFVITSTARNVGATVAHSGVRITTAGNSGAHTSSRISEISNSGASLAVRQAGAISFAGSTTGGTGPIGLQAQPGVNINAAVFVPARSTHVASTGQGAPCSSNTGSSAYGVPSTGNIASWTPLVINSSCSAVWRPLSSNQGGSYCAAPSSSTSSTASIIHATSAMPPSNPAISTFSAQSESTSSNSKQPAPTRGKNDFVKISPAASQPRSTESDFAAELTERLPRIEIGSTQLSKENSKCIESAPKGKSSAGSSKPGANPSANANGRADENEDSDAKADADENRRRSRISACSILASLPRGVSFQDYLASCSSNANVQELNHNSEQSADPTSKATKLGCSENNISGDILINAMESAGLQTVLPSSPRDRGLRPASGTATGPRVAESVLLPSTSGSMVVQPTFSSATLTPLGNVLQPVSGDTIIPNAGENVVLMPASGGLGLPLTSDNATILPSSGNGVSPIRSIVSPFSGEAILLPASGNNPGVPSKNINAKLGVHSNLNARAKSFEAPLTVNTDACTSGMPPPGFAGSNILHIASNAGNELQPITYTADVQRGSQPQVVPQNIVQAMPLIAGPPGFQYSGMLPVQFDRSQPPPNIAIGPQNQVVNSGPPTNFVSPVMHQASPINQYQFSVNPYMPRNPTNSANFIPNGLVYYNNPIEFNTHGEFQHRAYQNMGREPIRPNSPVRPIDPVIQNNMAHYGNQTGINPPVWNNQGVINQNVLDPNSQVLNQFEANSGVYPQEWNQSASDPPNRDLHQFAINNGYRIIACPFPDAINQLGCQVVGNPYIPVQLAGYYNGNHFIPQQGILYFSYDDLRDSPLFTGFQDVGNQNQGDQVVGIPNQGIPSPGIQNQGIQNQSIPNQGTQFNQGIQNQGNFVENQIPCTRYAENFDINQVSCAQNLVHHVESQTAGNQYAGVTQNHLVPNPYAGNENSGTNGENNGGNNVRINCGCPGGNTGGSNSGNNGGNNNERPGGRHTRGSKVKGKRNYEMGKR